MNEPTTETINRLKQDIIPFTEELNQVKLSSYQKQALLDLCDCKPIGYPYQQGKRTIELFYREFLDYAADVYKC